jgi:hypothetical protein
MGFGLGLRSGISKHDKHVASISVKPFHIKIGIPGAIVQEDDPNTPEDESKTGVWSTVKSWFGIT